MVDDEVIKADQLSSVRVMRSAGDLHINKQQLASLGEASEILAEARARAASLRSEALDEAAAEAIRGLTSRLLEAEKIRAQALSNATGDIVELAQVIARKIIGDTFTADPELLARLVREELAKQRPNEPVTLVVAPSSSDRISDLLSALRQELVDIPVSVELNDTLGANDFVVNSAVGRVDARIDTQLERIAEALKRKAGDD